MRYIHPFCIGVPNIVLFVIISLISIKEIISNDNIIIKIIGILLVIFLIILEKISHKTHKQAHTKAEKINKLVTFGIYSKIRHPIYLGWILFNIGAFLIIENLPSLITALIFILCWYLEARQEEKFIEKKFKDYKTYKKQTGMFFPKINS